jgi:phenylalanyl-tRNA synthetase alpha chain
LASDNYDKLYYPSDTITKSSKYTHWINDKKILRTHTTSGIPNLLREISDENSLYLLPGIVYRRDVIDKTHVGEPHQMDVWHVIKNKKVNREDLLELVSVIIESILPNIEWRYNETSHYYTKNGIEVEILINEQWLEVLECGEINPQLIEDCGKDSREWSGLALGIGLDRAVMIKKNISDIRTLRNSNEKISSQMQNLDLYKEVSNQPKIVTDLSISINKNIDSEILGDNIRALMNDSSLIEEVIIKSETSYESLPSHVQNRLGMTDEMKNVLISITLRSLDRTLTKEECSEITKYLYKELHEGNKGYL